ncbi:prepilin peptidase [Candidatus Gottesmanbacteria bacterium]|nr:prepilin peptidase [Candidatus Gottesmanbacteria bacterium]
MGFIVFLFGLAVGSFLNVLIDRLPKGKNVLTGRSICDHCNKTLRWFELIPLLSFVVQGGRCRRCHRLLSWQYPLVELVTAVGFVFLFQGQAFEARQGLALWGAGLVFSSLLVIFVADLKYQIIPDSMVVAGVLGVAMGLMRQMGPMDFMKEGRLGSALGASAFFFLLWLITRGKGMGLGDVKLAFLMGLLLGFPKIVVASYLAFLTGAIVGVILILLGKKHLKERIAFGPFLVVGTVMAIVWGQQIIALWKELL